ncbi:hypothetical protein GQR58_016880 [Nymphon striatum]|nr:hypothetical protein GQR58_016880 [Nymphon striatum]
MDQWGKCLNVPDPHIPGSLLKLWYRENHLNTINSIPKYMMICMKCHSDPEACHKNCCKSYLIINKTRPFHSIRFYRREKRKMREKRAVIVMVVEALPLQELQSTTTLPTSDKCGIEYFYNRKNE